LYYTLTFISAQGSVGSFIDLETDTYLQKSSRKVFGCQPVRSNMPREIFIEKKPTTITFANPSTTKTMFF